MQDSKLEQVFTWFIDVGFILCILNKVLVRFTICRMFTSIAQFSMCLGRIFKVGKRTICIWFAKFREMNVKIGKKELLSF